ncbi:MAG: DUF418 domain-containing protein [Phycisphaerales bacterium]|nr:MAG: DUF418 domain-containing protein [Phycisphaerales bacterium]
MQQPEEESSALPRISQVNDHGREVRADTLRPLAPISEPDRIASLDVLRGVAVLGILVMNIQAFSMVHAAYVNPTAYGSLEGADGAVWLLSHVLAKRKFMTIFSMLFGAGIIVLTSRAEARGRSALRLHYRRTLWLILFGLLHAYLLWTGDILYAYGMSALVAYWLRRLPPRWLVLIALVLLAIPSGVMMAMDWSIRFWSPEQYEAALWGWAPGTEEVEYQMSVYRGSWLHQLPDRAHIAFWGQTASFGMFGVWRILGCMFLGMALYRLGVFSASRSVRFYLALIVAAVLAGLPVTLLGVWLCHRNDWSLHYSMFQGKQFNYWASIPVALGWVGLVMLLCRSAGLEWMKRPLAAVGRTALSNYLFQTVICTTIFFGHGFSLFGRVSRVQQILFVLAIWVVQIVGSSLWMRYFRLGPLEWLWRSLSYWRFQPMLR